METFIYNSTINQYQLIDVIRQLNKEEKKQIFDFFRNDVFEYFIENENIEKMTFEEYNNKLAESEIALEKGEFLTQTELEKEVLKWK